MKKTVYLLIAILALSAVPALAQGPFTDVPTDHWAYDAVNTLQKDGVLIGYPDGTFGGKRTITRYEFAVALARTVAMINPDSGVKGLSKADVEGMLSDYAKKSDIPSAANLSNLATKADVDAIKKLVDEFRDEIAALGVDVDALKRDVAALCARVDALEAEVKRVRISGDVNVFAIASSSRQNTTVDLDNRTTAQGETLLRNIGLVKDFDLKIAGRISDKTTAVATINYGDYLNYLGFVDDYIGGPRPTRKAGNLAVNGSNIKDSLSDTFFPYYLSIETALGKGALSVGRFPMQFTPYTLKKIDVDSYTSILKTDDGNYPVDGAKLGFNFAGVDLTLFAVKNDQNDFLANGLTGQPSSGPGVLHQLAVGNAVGGLNQVTQTAGVRAGLNIPFNGVLGLTYYQAWDQLAFNALANYDQARVFGADLNMPLPFLPSLALSGSWTQSDTLARDGAVGVSDVDYGNIAWDGKLTATVFSNVAIGAGYKSIGRNFAAAGAWDKIGRWTNPVNVKGPYADVAIPLACNLKIALNGEFLNTKDNDPTINGGDWGSNDGDTVTKAEAAIRWGFNKTNALDASYQWVRFSPDTEFSATESYITIGLAHQMNPNAGIKVGYQFIGYNDGNTGSGPYDGDYRGGLGVVQMGVSF